MRLLVKDMDVATGGPLIAVMNEKDAAKLDLHLLDRIKIKKGVKEAIVVVDFAKSEKAVPRGKIGLFEEVLSKLNARNNSPIKIYIEEKPLSLQFIKKKLDGKELNYDEIKAILTDAINNILTEVELTYYVAANYTRGMSIRETVALTKAMIDTGEKLKLKNRHVIDKHCIGGVCGNRTTPVVVPILIAAGLTVPKTSSRSITSPAGTADTMEVFTNVSLPMKQIKKVIAKVGGCMVWGGGVDLAPADDTIINVEHPMSIDAEGQLLSSIMAKKGSVSATHVMIDIPIGRDAKIESRKEALHLKREFEKIGKVLKMKIKVVITDGSQPVGNGMGPALEAIDIVRVLKNDPRAPQDLRKKSLMMAGILLEMTGKAKKGKGLKTALEIVESGRAYKKFVDIIRAQGAKLVDERKIRLGRFTYDFKVSRSGRVRHINNKAMAKIARLAGSPNDKGAGIYLHKKKWEPVKKGEKIFTIYAESRLNLKFAVDIARKIDGFVVR